MAASVRAWGWALVCLAAGLVSFGLTRSPGWTDSGMGLALVLAFGGGLALEMAMLAVGQLRDRGRVVEPPEGARPADGLVETLAMVGVVGVKLSEMTAWKRFCRVDPNVTGSGRVVRSPGSENPPLLGQVALVSVFVGRDGHPWTNREIRDAHKSLRSVARWVEREARTRSALVNVGLADTYFQVEDDHRAAVELDFVPEGDDVGPMEADSTTKSMAGASRAASLLGFADVADLVGRINPRINADVAVWLFHLKSRGRSHAIPAGDRVVRGVGVAICHARESSFPEPLLGPGRVDPTTVAHELMHLFGASDKYGIALADFPPKSVGRLDIMRLDETRLDRLKIGKLTASEVGWRVGP